MTLSNSLQKILSHACSYVKNSPKIMGSAIPFFSALAVISLFVIMAKHQSENTTATSFQASAQNLPIVVAAFRPQAGQTSATSKVTTATTRADKIIDNTVNMHGFVEANAVSSENGVIVLSKEHKRTSNPVTTAENYATQNEKITFLSSNTINTISRTREQRYFE